MLLLMPRFAGNVLSSLADQPVAMVLAIAALCAVLWLLEDRLPYLFLCAILLAAAALIKNEGLLFGLIVVVSLGVSVLFEDRRRWKPVAALGAVPLLAILPWKIWLAANGQPTSSDYYSWSSFLHPVRLVERGDRLGRLWVSFPSTC
jgi:4-amino-4-deoxy-L-arabinose transferase-like glycosyltransferase